MSADVFSNELDKVFRAKSRLLPVSAIKEGAVTATMNESTYSYLPPNVSWSLSVTPVPSAILTVSSILLREGGMTHSKRSGVRNIFSPLSRPPLYCSTRVAVMAVG